jgi:lipopolysaccharide export LptBFGC system permease protein LptF
MRWVLIVAAAICEAFAYWGMKTVAGRAAFDEMAGIIPLAAAPLGLCLAIAALILWWRRTRARGTSEPR